MLPTTSNALDGFDVPIPKFPFGRAVKTLQPRLSQFKPKLLEILVPVAYPIHQTLVEELLYEQNPISLLPPFDKGYIVNCVLVPLRFKAGLLVALISSILAGLDVPMPINPLEYKQVRIFPILSLPRPRLDVDVKVP